MKNNNFNPILNEDWKESLVRHGIGAGVGAAAGALGKGIVNKIKGKKFTDDIGTWALLGAGAGGLARNRIIQGYVKDYANKTRDIVGGTINFVKPGKQTSMGKRNNAFRHKVLKNAKLQMSGFMPSAIQGAVINSALTYLFTTKEKLLNDLIAAYQQEEDPVQKKAILKEIKKVENASEEKLKLMAVLRRGIWGGLIAGVAMKGAKVIGKNIVQQQQIRRESAPRIDRKTRQLVSSDLRKRHSAIFGALGNSIRGTQRDISNLHALKNLAQTNPDKAIEILKSLNPTDPGTASAINQLTSIANANRIFR